MTRTSCWLGGLWGRCLGLTASSGPPMGTDAAIDKNDLKIKVKCYEEICMACCIGTTKSLILSSYFLQFCWQWHENGLFTLVTIFLTG